MTEVNNPATTPDVPCISMTIGRTTHLVYVHFSKTSTETMEDKITRMIRNEVENLRSELH